MQPSAEPLPADQGTTQPPTPEAGETPPPQLREPRETPRPPMREPRNTPPPPPQEPQRRGPMAVSEAIEEVNQIIETLRATLDDMDTVLETLELAERQKLADEHEIETLRRGLRQLHRPREGGPQPPRH